MRLIDADKLPLDIEHEDIDDAPTIDAVEVVHGEWIGDGFNPLACSICGATTDAIKGIRWADRFYKYCPNCGAKMDGEVKQDEQTI